MKLCFAALLLAAVNSISALSATPPWREILGPAQSKVPLALEAAVELPVLWRTNLTQSLADARASNRPLFVTFRCLPCKQCSDFDKAVLEGGSELSPILRQFVTVRLTDAADIDFNIFPIEGFADMDLSWWGWFLSPEARVYGVFGGRDHLSDSTRISNAALIASLQRALAHHHDPRRAKWDIDLRASCRVSRAGKAAPTPRRRSKAASTAIRSTTSSDSPPSRRRLSTSSVISMCGRCRKTSASRSTATTACG
jgi:hypothetical protein